MENQQLALTDKVTFVDVYEEVAQDLTCDAFRNTIAIINSFREDGDITPFKDKAVQENIYNTFCLVDWLERLGKDIKETIGEIVDVTKKFDEDGKPVTGMYGMKIKNTGSTTKVLDAYKLINKVAEDEKVDKEAILKKVSISVKDLAKACDRSEDYIKKTYPDYISITKKKDAVVRAF